MMNEAFDDFDVDTNEGTVAWQENEGGTWSKVHDTIDFGKTTICGVKVPEITWMSDSFSTQGHCKRCLMLLKKVTK